CAFFVLFCRISKKEHYSMLSRNRNISSHLSSPHTNKTNPIRHCERGVADVWQSGSNSIRSTRFTAYQSFACPLSSAPLPCYDILSIRPLLYRNFLMKLHTNAMPRNVFMPASP
ncbi:MAG: hypothetical protein LBS99_05645, partial [Clostridiales bacterium]|nr:hypothetical protein [Clostridiales bacterium]